jgi:hypothetical protein
LPIDKLMDLVSKSTDKIVSAGGSMNDNTHIPMGHVYDDRQHSRLLRIFTVACILSAILILALVGVAIYSILAYFILSEAETDAANLGRALLEQEMKTFIRSDSEGGTHIAIDEKEFPSFDRSVQRNLVFFQVFKIKIYAKDQKIAYSTDRAIIGKKGHKNEGLDRALRGEAVSLLQSGRDVWDLDDEQRLDRDMVETYLPIRDRNNKVVGAFEIYVDVSSYRAGIRRLLVPSLGALFIILTCIFGTLIYFMRQSTKTIYSRTQELRILSGLLPICSFCKKIRNKEGDWELLESYITARSESKFTHGLCPQCREKHYPER